MSVALLGLDDFVLVSDTDCDTTEELDVLKGPCTVHEVMVKNALDTYFYLWLWDRVDPTIGTTPERFKWRFEKNSTDTVNEGYSTFSFGSDGINFDTALSFAGSTAASGSGDPASSVEVVLKCKRA